MACWPGGLVGDVPLLAILLTKSGFFGANSISCKEKAGAAERERERERER
jgi:hypothetical protein